MLDDEPKAPKNNKFCDNTVIGGYGISVTDTAIGVHLERKNNVYIEGMKDVTAEWEEDKAFIEV